VELPRLGLVDVRESNLGMLAEPRPASLKPPRLLAVEFCLDSPGAACALHLLLTLSDRLSMALCTNPPMPFVGDGDLAAILEDASEGFRVGASNGDFESGPDDAMENLLVLMLKAALFLTEFVLDGDDGRKSSGGGLLELSAAPRKSLDMPGSPR